MNDRSGSSSPGAMMFAKLRTATNNVQTFSQDVRQYVTTMYTKARQAATGAMPGGGEKYISLGEAVSILHDELQYPEARAAHFVKLFDKNGDGRLSFKELEHFKQTIKETKAQLLPKFKEYDLDGNGSISLDEAAAILSQPPFKFPVQKVALMLSQFDKDGNGKLDINEFTGFYAEAKASNDEMASRFEQLDTDGNGTLSLAELTAIIKERMGFDDRSAKNFVDMFDDNHDGQIDKTEFVNMWSSMFG